MAERCRNCGARVVESGYRNSWSPRWVHQPEGAAFQDGQYEYCHTTRAEPAEGVIDGA